MPNIFQKCSYCDKDILELTVEESIEARKICKFITNLAFVHLIDVEFDVRGLGSAGDWYFCSLDCCKEFIQNGMQSKSKLVEEVLKTFDSFKPKWAPHQTETR